MKRFGAMAHHLNVGLHVEFECGLLDFMRSALRRMEASPTANTEHLRSALRQHISELDAVTKQPDTAEVDAA